jgi:hypothetical protein
MENIQFIKSIIPIEIDLGFIRIPNKYKNIFPLKKSRISFYLGKSDKVSELSYNPKFQRIFGLKGFFKLKNVEPRDVLRFEKISDKKFRILLEKTSRKESVEKPLGRDEAEEIIDVGEISSQAKGNIVEDRIKELIMLYGQGILNVYEPAADVEGIDLVVLKRNVFQPIFIQVKGRFKLRGNSFQIVIKSKALNPHHTLFIVGAYYDPQRMDIDDYIIFAPTKDFIKTANIVYKGTEKEAYVLNTPLRINTNNRFSEFIIRKDNLVLKIFEKFNEIEKYYK